MTQGTGKLLNLYLNLRRHSGSGLFLFVLDYDCIAIFMKSSVILLTPPHCVLLLTPPHCVLSLTTPHCVLSLAPPHCCHNKLGSHCHRKVDTPYIFMTPYFICPILQQIPLWIYWSSAGRLFLRQVQFGTFKNKLDCITSKKQFPG